jgi:glycosyltransferase involved in cell wall biosynthesis
MRPALVGPLPPPTHGFSVINAGMLRALGGPEVVEVFDLSPRAGGLAAKLARFAGLALGGGCECLYLALSGGARQAVDAAFLAVAALARAPVVVHHHSFAYLNRPTTLSRLALRLAGRGVHVALCGCMAERLAAVYSIPAEQIRVISNAAFVGEAPAGRAARPPGAPTLGYLSAVRAEKGVLDFLALAREALASGAAARAIVAGPVEESFRETFLQALAAAPGAEYLGPVYGPEKAAFFEAIDLLAFPSRYANEAEPVTILEAAAAGVPTLATTRGCIAEMVERLGGRVLPEGSGFAQAALAVLSELGEGEALAELGRSVRDRYTAHRRAALAERDRLLGLITGAGG